MNEKVKNNIIRLVEASRDIIACSMDENGFPNAKAMFKLKHEGLQTFWFSTNLSSIRTQQWLKCPNACLYFLDSKGFHGMMLVGNMKVCTDNETKQNFWKPGDEKYYPQGPTDPDYCILKFAADKGNYYHGSQKHLFSVTDL